MGPIRWLLACCGAALLTLGCLRPAALAEGDRVGAEPVVVRLDERFQFTVESPKRVTIGAKGSLQLSMGVAGVSSATSLSVSVSYWAGELLLTPRHLSILQRYREPPTEDAVREDQSVDLGSGRRITLVSSWFAGDLLAHVLVSGEGVAVLLKVRGERLTEADRRRALDRVLALARTVEFLTAATSSRKWY